MLSLKNCEFYTEFLPVLVYKLGQLTIVLGLYPHWTRDIKGPPYCTHSAYIYVTSKVLLGPPPPGRRVRGGRPPFSLRYKEVQPEALTAHASDQSPDSAIREAKARAHE